MGMGTVRYRSKVTFHIAQAKGHGDSLMKALASIPDLRFVFGDLPRPDMLLGSMKQNGYGSKLNHQGIASFSAAFAFSKVPFWVPTSHPQPSTVQIKHALVR